MIRAFKLALAVASLAWAGCNSGGPRPMRVWGDVRFDGRPIEEGDVVFVPAPGNTGPATGGRILGGKYDIPAADGPYAGVTYRVEVKAQRKNGKTAPNPMNASAPPIELYDFYVPERYNTQSVLRATISASASENRFDFALKQQ